MYGLVKNGAKEMDATNGTAATGWSHHMKVIDITRVTGVTHLVETGGRKAIGGMETMEIEGIGETEDTENMKVIGIIDKPGK